MSIALTHRTGTRNIEVFLYMMFSNRSALVKFQAQYIRIPWGGFAVMTIRERSEHYLRCQWRGRSSSVINIVQFNYHDRQGILFTNEGDVNVEQHIACASGSF